MQRQLPEMEDREKNEKTVSSAVIDSPELRFRKHRRYDLIWFY